MAISISYLVFYYTRTYFSKKNKFQISVKKQSMQILVLLLAGIMNSYNLKYIILLNIILLFVSMVIQRDTLRTIQDIRKNPINYDFS